MVEFDHGLSHMANKKEKTEYDHFKALHPMSLDSNLEELACRLFELSTKGLEPVWDETKKGTK